MKMQGRGSSRNGTLGLALMAPFLTATPLDGQTGSLDVESALACFEQQARDPRTECPQGVVSAAVVFLPSKDYAEETVRAVLDGLEQMALTAEDRTLRIAAAHTIAFAGRASDRPIAGIVRRLERLYRETPFADVRALVVREAPQQAELEAAVEFLAAAASDELAEDPYEPSIPELAVIGLARMGAAGRTMLQELQQVDAVKDPSARARLRQLAESGFDPEPR